MKRAFLPRQICDDVRQPDRACETNRSRWSTQRQLRHRLERNNKHDTHPTSLSDMNSPPRRVQSATSSSSFQSRTQSIESWRKSANVLRSRRIIGTFKELLNRVSEISLPGVTQQYLGMSRVSCELTAFSLEVSEHRSR